MEKEIAKKRRRADEKNSAVKTNRSPALERTNKKGNARRAITKPGNFSDDFDDLIEKPDPYWERPIGIFDFPWLHVPGALAPELDNYSLRDVFFTSLVDGCSATIGFPGDRLSRPNDSPIILPATADDLIPPDGDDEGFESIWSSILQQPLSVVYCPKATGA